MRMKQGNTAPSRGIRRFSQSLFLLLALQVTGCDKGDGQQAKAPAPDLTAVAESPSPEKIPAAVAPVQPAPAPVPSPFPPPGTKPLSSIESLVAPIALYPDPLLAEMLVAASYPLEVVQAARWLESKPNPATVRGKNWDASVIRLTAMPEVIAMMSEHLDWTTQLGDAFLANPTELMDAVQALRKRATDAGYLKNSDLQKVETKTVSFSEPASSQARGSDIKATPAVLTKQVITIAPAKADTLSVPSYNPEVVYAAPLAPPPASYAYPASTTVTNNYYPSANTTTQTTSSSDQWLSFGAGAVVGGLLTWGIMEWADEWHGGYPVSHHYGDSVCQSGNCWHGGGGYYRNGNVAIDRGDVNINRGDVNIGSGNRVNVDRDGMFKQDQLAGLGGQASRWQPDASHRRGQAYPPIARQRLGNMQEAALAGGRLSGAENLPANTRGFDDKKAATLPAQPRLSSADVQRQLAARSDGRNLAGKSDLAGRATATPRDSALADMRANSQRVKTESQRGAASINSRTREVRKPTVNDRAGLNQQRLDRVPSENRRPMQQDFQRPAHDAQQFQNRQNQQTQRFQSQQRREMSRPNAFESAQDLGRSRDFSSRGSASRASAQTSRQMRTSTGGASRAGAAGRVGGGGRGGRR